LQIKGESQKKKIIIRVDAKLIVTFPGFNPLSLFDHDNGGDIFFHKHGI
jgi:hypothetical protein